MDGLMNMADEIAIRMVDPVLIYETDSWCSVQTACWCGSVFEASGAMTDVNQRYRDWTAAHQDCKEQPRTGHRIFWLSFCDADLPEGSQFLGACIIDVTAAEADEAAIDVLLRFPLAEPDAEWLAAAIKKTHALGCNPGGEVASAEFTECPYLSRYRLGILMDRATIEHIDAEIADAKVRQQCYSRRHS